MSLWVDTDYPIAAESIDHVYPRGTMLDNSVNPNFNRSLEKFFGECKFAVLDLGCAGGGMVQSFLDCGHLAVGIEGSDYSKIHRRAAWAQIPDHLFTADATKPFTVRDDLGPCQFDVITAWEFFEHIEESDLEGVMENILRHIQPTGYLIGSTTDSSSFNRAEHHRTRKPITWWMLFFRKYGFHKCARLEKEINGNWVRKGKFRLALERKVVGNG